MVILVTGKQVKGNWSPFKNSCLLGIVQFGALPFAVSGDVQDVALFREMVKQDTVVEA